MLIGYNILYVTLYFLCLQGITALMYAVINDHAKVVSELILAKADPSLKSKVSTLYRQAYRFNSSKFCHISVVLAVTV